MSTLTRELIFRPAYDKRDPDPAKNYGIHGVEMLWVLKGAAGAVQFLLYTGWNLPHVREEMKNAEINRLFPMPADLGYHSPMPMYPGQSKISDECEILGGTCYYDGSSLNAHRIFDVLVSKGGDAVWDELENYYLSVFAESGDA